MARLRQTVSGEIAVLEAEHLVGRSQRAALHLDNPYVSAQHATIRWGADGWELRDLGSRNGTFVDDAPIRPGHPFGLIQGARISFGHVDQTWELVDATAPRPMVVPLDPGSEPLFLEGDILALPSQDDPRATVLRGADGSWRLERDDEVVALSPHHLFEVSGRRFRFSCPDVLSETSTVDWHHASGIILLRLGLRFRVSKDEEFVEVHVEGGREPVNLGSRGHNYLLLLLARARLDDIEQHLSDSAAGWMYQDDLIQALRVSSERLNIDIFRIRKQFSGIPWVPDATHIVERRPRTKQLRIGMASLAIDPI